MSSTPIVKHYTNGEVTIVWQPALCIHSRNCVRGLPGVFDFERRPWIDPTAAASAAIVAQVAACPSGALSCYRNADGPPATGAPAETAAAEAPAAAPAPAEPLRVQVQRGGPLLITGPIEVMLPGGQCQTHPRTALCRCGQSANKPYCDGAHGQLPPGWDAGETSAARPA